MTSASKIIAKVRSKTKAVGAELSDDDRPFDVAALKAEFDAALEAGDKWEGRDPSVIEAEIHQAERAARVASELNTSADGSVTRREFDQFKIAVAVAFMGIEAALRDPSVSPRRVLNLVMENVAAIGLSREQAKELADFERRANVVEKHYSRWDRATKSQREYAAREAAMRRPRGFA